MLAIYIITAVLRCFDKAGCYVSVFAQGTTDGPATTVVTRLHVTPTGNQIRNRRNALWLRALEAGMPDEHGTMRPHTPRELAALWGISKQAVLNGIAAARAVAAYRETLCA